MFKGLGQWRFHATALIQFDLERVEPVGRAGTKTKGDDHRIGHDDFFRAGNRFRSAAAAFIRLAQLCGDDFNAFDPAIADDFNRLAVPEKLHAFFFGVGDFAFGAGHVGLVAAIGATDRERTLTNRGAVAVHRGVAATEDDHMFAVHINKVSGIFFQFQTAFNIGDQKRQGLINAG